MCWSGELAHKDSTGQRQGHTARRRSAHERRHAACGTANSTTPPNEQTHISCRSGSNPTSRGIAPSYEQKTFPSRRQAVARLRLVAAPGGAADSVTIHADARIYAGLFDGTEAAVLPIDPARKAYVFVARGSVAVNDQALDTGDAALLSAESRITVSEGRQAEVLVFDLAP
jgi:hypothetical protein